MVLGISKLQSASKNQDEKENENDEYVSPSLIEKFDRRWDDVVITGKDVKEEDFRKDMSLKEFCDRFDSKRAKLQDADTPCLHLTIKRETFDNAHSPI